MPKVKKIEIPHCATCGNQTDVPTGATLCHLCAGPIVLGDPWVTEFRKQLRGTRAMVQVAKEDGSD
ncbi:MULTISPECIES: hypothetical protein [unclassified Cupriavidus]|uniref:hypothetical protein n=1 Tax=unclassified Cupriavidus TaxID=2640874 RepID=UPI00313B2C76